MSEAHPDSHKKREPQESHPPKGLPIAVVNRGDGMIDLRLGDMEGLTWLTWLTLNSDSARWIAAQLVAMADLLEKDAAK